MPRNRVSDTITHVTLNTISNVVQDVFETGALVLWYTL